MLIVIVSHTFVVAYKYSPVSRCAYVLSLSRLETNGVAEGFLLYGLLPSFVLFLTEQDPALFYGASVSHQPPFYGARVSEQWPFYGAAAGVPGGSLSSTQLPFSPPPSAAFGLATASDPQGNQQQMPM